MDTPFIENSSDFAASFDSAHIEKICFSIKIRALVITLLILNSSSSFLIFYTSFVVSFKIHFIFRDFSIYMFDFRHCIVLIILTLLFQ